MPSNSVKVGPGRAGVRPVHRFNESTNPIMFINIYFNFFVKVLKLFEYPRGDPYMTADRNFVRFTHSYSYSKVDQNCTVLWCCSCETQTRTGFRCFGEALVRWKNVSASVGVGGLLLVRWESVSALEER